MILTGYSVLNDVKEMEEGRVVQLIVKDGDGCDGGLSKWTCCDVLLWMKIQWFTVKLM